MAYTIRIRNPIIGKEVMRIETDNETLALSEAEYFSIRHGIAEVYDEKMSVEVACFRYGVKQSTRK